jgi:hypothetical protein
VPSRGVLARVGAGGVESIEAMVSMLSISFFFFTFGSDAAPASESILLCYFQAPADPCFPIQCFCVAGFDDDAFE